MIVNLVIFQLTNRSGRPDHRRTRAASWVFRRPWMVARCVFSLTVAGSIRSIRFPNKNSLKVKDLSFRNIERLTG